MAQGGRGLAQPIAHNTADPAALVRGGEAEACGPPCAATRHRRGAGGLAAVPIMGPNPLCLWRSGPAPVAASARPSAQAQRQRRASLPDQSAQLAMVERMPPSSMTDFPSSTARSARNGSMTPYLAAIARSSADTGRRVHMHLLRDRLSEGMGRGRLPRRAGAASRCRRTLVRAADRCPWRPSRRRRLRAAGRAGRDGLAQRVVQPGAAAVGHRACRVLPPLIVPSPTGFGSGWASTAWPSTTT